MRPSPLPVFSIFFAVLLLFSGAAKAQSVDTTIMSFNIRYAGANDEANNWSQRRHLVIQTIAAHKPAIFGVQECLWDQGQELAAAFSNYQMTGAGRNDGKRAGEMCAIFTRTDRYNVLDSGVFWLSETPDTPGSKGWDAALPRIATWVQLADTICQPDTFFVFNTHFDHAGAQARQNSAKLLYQRITSLAGAQPIILMGDFNDSASPASSSYATLTTKTDDDSLDLQDTWHLASRDQRMQGEGTFHGFSGEATRGRIDWILTTPHWPGVDAGIDRREQNGQYPSDHFPVWVTVRLAQQ